MGSRVDYYGSPTPLSQLATLTVPDPRSIVIQPWDTSVVGEIEKAILKSELGLTPMNDGKAIRINIPPLTAERRRESCQGGEEKSRGIQGCREKHQT